MQTDDRSKVLVVVRVRPLLSREVASGHTQIIRVMGGRMVVMSDPKRLMDTQGLSRRPKERKYAFDHAFSDEAGQEEVFSVTTSFLMDSLLDGYNATVFAYGATGSGKTYTMTGTHLNPGIMFLTLRELFLKTTHAKDTRGQQYRVTLSYLEIYNENIRDLMKGDDTHLDLREHPTLGMRVSCITEYEVSNVEEIMELLQAGNENRTVEPTEANACSSRSHAVLQITIELHDKVSDKISTAKLNLIDLAGSERGAVTQNRGIRLVEGANINRSLLALGNCINALCESKTTFVPYRDSKLTRLLKDSLGGNCQTVMITNVSPSHSSIEESANTLKYASRAKKIRNNVTRNEHTVAHQVAEYDKVISDLKREVSTLRVLLDDQSATSMITSTVSNGFSQYSESEKKNFEDIRQALSKTFDKSTKLEKSISEVDELQMSHYLVVNEMQTSLEESKLRGIPLSDDIRRTANVAHEKVEKNERLKAALKDKLSLIKSDQQDINNRITQFSNKELRELLVKERDFHILEQNYFHLKSQNNKQNQLSENKDAQLKRLRLHVWLRDAIIKNQREVLSSHGIQNDTLNDSYVALNSTNYVQPTFVVTTVAPQQRKKPVLPSIKLPEQRTVSRVTRRAQFPYLNPQVRQSRPTSNSGYKVCFLFSLLCQPRAYSTRDKTTSTTGKSS